MSTGKRAISDDQRLDLIRQEMGLLQNVFDKYDDLIFRNRNFFVTLWIAGIAASATIKIPALSLCAALLALAYWFLEGMLRYNYMFKYVMRYRTIRDAINADCPPFAEISVFDLTNYYIGSNRRSWRKVRQSFLKSEPLLLYGLMGAIAVVFYLLS